ncbi:Acetyl-CoA acetyltransferase [Rubripirellula amarantea]|uniref:Acetyl-CoA acetyltransferase n=1 Tax=Rubripirellula amarantea TaxID=2527999 RepID=A0A5C5WFX8_9BACT|nr:thiolase family protein [Rubripirellula amarantea]TWT49668.1 Acetyl-CoA acetyltransferase [Rubripirellula amarantea]
MNTHSPIAVLDAVRTPFAKAFTDLSGVSAVELGRTAMTGLLTKLSCRCQDVDEVIFGNVGSPADAANIARVIALRSGLSYHTIAHTVHRNCGSGMEAILGGWQAINHRGSKLVITGGTESMSSIPLFFSKDAQAYFTQLGRSKSWLQKLRTIRGFRPSFMRPIAGLRLGLTDPVCHMNMGETAELLAKEFRISREDQDRFALESHHKAEAAFEACYLTSEVTPVELENGKKVERDNTIRVGQTMQALAKLKPVFAKQGSVTAGNSSPLTDGAAALALCLPEHVSEYTDQPLGYVTAYSIAGCDPSRMGLGPVYAIAKLMDQTGYTLNDFDLIEINEAFAAQVIACRKAIESRHFAADYLNRRQALGEWPEPKVNVLGGAIALGHPVGATGARLVLTLLRTLKARGLHRGLATLCIGGGQGMAMVVETQIGSES